MSTCEQPANLWLRDFTGRTRNLCTIQQDIGFPIRAHCRSFAPHGRAFLQAARERYHEAHASNAHAKVFRQRPFTRDHFFVASRLTDAKAPTSPLRTDLKIWFVKSSVRARPVGSLLYSSLTASSRSPSTHTPCNAQSWSAQTSFARQKLLNWHCASDQAIE